MNRVKIENLNVEKNLLDFINQDALPGTDVEQSKFWASFSKSIYKLNPINKNLLEKRKDLQRKIDNWHLENKSFKENKDSYISFLKSIGYIVDTKSDFKIRTQNVDDEIAKIPGPQLVVPVDNARYALNAANARWGSLYNSLYGTDVIPGEKYSSYNPERAKKVIDYVRRFFDEIFPLEKNSWFDVTKVMITDKNLVLFIGDKKDYLKNKGKFIGFNGNKNNPSCILLKNNNLHIEIVFDPNSQVGKSDKANISDVIVESAISTIIDNEDSVAAVDSSDKVKCYKNWLGLMKGNLQVQMEKNGKKFIRKLNPDRTYTKFDGTNIALRGRALMLNRNVGHLMTNSSITLSDGCEIPEGIMDAFISTLCALHDFKSKQNSTRGSVYIVKPKMHGPDEVEFTNNLFEEVEAALGLKKYTIKVGIMDEERRTTVNLKECIRKVQDRIVFINTGFLDRTGDEMHTSFEAGPMIFKGEMKKSNWLKAYEDLNVDIGLACGFSGIAQIGKGMWAMPDKMADMMTQKRSHPESGANCAWVPSPTAATLHSTHYHHVNVFEKHKSLSGQKRSDLDSLLDIPVADRPNWQIEKINSELENNAQSILGYVVRWIDQGIGCSKVPDINNVGLMEDRATLRISSQHIANWLHHKICSKEQVIEVFKKMARTVDEQNQKDKDYQKMSNDFDKSVAFKTACSLVLNGKDQPSGYTEPLLHSKRIEKKTSH